MSKILATDWLLLLSRKVYTKKSSKPTMLMINLYWCSQYKYQTIIRNNSVLNFLAAKSFMHYNSSICIWLTCSNFVNSNILVNTLRYHKKKQGNNLITIELQWLLLLLPSFYVQFWALFLKLAITSSTHRVKEDKALTLLNKQTWKSYPARFPLLVFTQPTKKSIMSRWGSTNVLQSFRLVPW